MKKLLTAILAFSCAFGAWAEVKEFISGTDFSTYPVGVFNTETDDSGLTGLSKRYWFTGNKEDFDGEVVNVSSNEDASVVENYLEFESNITNPVYRTINDCYNVQSPDAVDEEGEPIGFKPQKIGDGLFIDTTVQFTPYLVNENHPAPEPLTDKDKIIVWVREEESENEGEANRTNLIVTAGFIEAGPSVSVKHYEVFYDSDGDGVDDADKLCQGRHRLTIKAFKDISANLQLEIAGFVVYVDEKKVEYYNRNDKAFDGIDVSLDATPSIYYTDEKKSLFPSLMGNTQKASEEDKDNGGDEISAVGFAGMGQVGEVWFDDYSTVYPSFAGDEVNFTIIVDDSVTSYTYNGETYTETKTFAVKPGTESIAVSNVTYNTANGWKAKAGTWFAGATQVMNAGSADGDWGTFSFENGFQFTIAGFKANFLVGDKEYETFLGNVSEEGGAFQAAKTSGNELKMMSDADVSQQIQVTVRENLTIDLNGHTIMLRGSYAATIENAGTLTINDSKGGGKVLGVINGTEYVNLSIVNAGTLTINGGSYEGVVPEYVIAEEAGTTIGSATINGGEFMNSIVEDDNGQILKPTDEEFHLFKSVPEDLRSTITVSESTKVIATGAAFEGVENIKPAYYTTVAASAGGDDEEVSYTITYDTEYGTQPTAVTVTVTSGTSYALTEGNLPTLTAEGFTFGGWSLTEGGAAVKAGDTISSSITLYALWTEDVDPWEPEEETDVSATNKVAEIFGADSPAATNITSYAEYTNLVAYVKAVKDDPDFAHTSLTPNEKLYIVDSLKLGAAELFTAKPKIKLTAAQPSTEDNAEAGDWVFEVKVTQGEADEALEVAKDKVKALVKIRSDLKTGQWAAPDAANIDADPVTDGNEITIKIKFGDAKSGFMMIRERE